MSLFPLVLNTPQDDLIRLCCNEAYSILLSFFSVKLPTRLVTFWRGGLKEGQMDKRGLCGFVVRTARRSFGAFLNDWMGDFGLCGREEGESV